METVKEEGETSKEAKKEGKELKFVASVHRHPPLGVPKSLHGYRNVEPFGGTPPRTRVNYLFQRVTARVSSFQVAVSEGLPDGGEGRRVSLFVLEPEISAHQVLMDLGESFPLVPQGEGRERFTYLDTFDWRLWAAGLTLASAPHGRGVRLLLLADDGRSWEAWEPHPPEFSRDLPPGSFRDILEEASGIRRLLPRAHVRWHEERFALRDESQKTVARVRILKGNASLPDSPETAPLRTQLHLDPLEGCKEEFERAVSLLQQASSLELWERGELTAILAPLGRAPGDYSSTFGLDLHPEMPSGEALKAVHRHLLDILLANQDGVIKDLDPEFLHDFRVAVRRTRSALTQVPHVFPQSDLLRFSQGFRWLGERTGPTRDLDVYLLRIPAYREALPEGLGDQLEPLVRFLSRKKRLEHRRMVRSLGTKRYARLMDDWRAFLQSPLETGPDLPNAARPIRLVASERIWKAYKKVLKRGRKTNRKTSSETLHRLRIDCKKLRYLMTFFESLFPKETLRPLIKDLKNLQDNLGDFNDLYLQRASLLGFAGEMMASGAAPPATLMAMGQLMMQLEARQSVEGEAFRTRFRKFVRPKKQVRFRSLFRSESGPE